MTQAEKAERFRALHQGPSVLVLPNAWDAASARIFERAGFPAVATTSAGIASSLGVPDGQQLSRAEMLAVVARIAAAADVPVTADLEAGYGASPEAAAETARAALAAGAVGMNLEDSWMQEGRRALADLGLQEDRVRAARAAAGPALFLNARTDGLIYGLGDFDDAVRRLNAYLRAGADCGYPIGVLDVKTIAAFTRAVEGPINVLAGPGSPPVAELERLGVRRVTFGGAFTRAALGLTRRLAEQLRQHGSFGASADEVMSPAEAKQLFSGR